MTVNQFELVEAALDAKVDGYATRVVEDCSTIINGESQKNVLHAQLRSAWFAGRSHGFQEAREMVLLRIAIIGAIMFFAGIGNATFISWVLR